MAMFAQTPTFDVASVKLAKDDGGTGSRHLQRSYGPQSVIFGGYTLAFIISDAWQFPPGRIIGPGSLTKQSLWPLLATGYDIEGKADHPVTNAQLRLMLQTLLAERFQLAMHRETKTGPVYKLALAKGGPKFEEASGGGLVMAGAPEGFVFRNAEIFRLAGYLGSRVDREVVDDTGLQGLYNFTVKIPEEMRQNQPAKTAGGTFDAPTAAIFSDVLKPLGLQLVAGSAPVEYLVVDRVEKPAGN